MGKDTSLAVTTSDVEQADREAWARRWAERYAAAKHLPVPAAQARTALRDVPIDDPRLLEAAEDWRQVLAVLGIDVPKPAAGTCPLCGKAKSPHDIYRCTGPCQPCMRRMHRGGGNQRKENGRC